MKQTNKIENSGLSNDAKTIVTVLCLVFVYPVGLILMFVWMKWPWWVKLLCLLIFVLPALIVLAIVGVILSAVLVSVNPAAQLAKAKDVKLQKDAGYMITAVESYYVKNNKTPWGTDPKQPYSTDNFYSESWINELKKGDDVMPNFEPNYEVPFRFDVQPGLTKMTICFDSVAVKGKEICTPDSMINKAL